MNILYKKETTLPVEAMEERLRAAAQNHQFGILNATDLREKMRSKGLEFAPACMVFDVCNPRRAKDVLESNMDISTALPCRISVYEKNGATCVATLLPTQVIGLFGSDGLETASQAVEEALKAIIDEAIASPSS